MIHTHPVPARPSSSAWRHPDWDTERSIHCPACGKEAERSDRSLERWAQHALAGRAWRCSPDGCGAVFALELRGAGRELAVERAEGQGLEEAARRAAGRSRAARRR